MSATATPSSPSLRSGALSRLGDEALARRAATGSDGAFTALYERYHGPLLGYCRSILLNDEDAHDATQNALESALRSLARRKPGRPLRPWLYRIAHNEAINIVRRRRPHTELTELDEPTVPGPEVDSEHRIRLAQLVDDLRGLPERQRGALVMRELSGLSYDDIAVALGVSNEAARRAVFDARSALHAAVDGRATACVSVRHCISDGDRRSLRARHIRAHLRSCNDCASFQLAIRSRSADLHMLGPWLSGATLASVLGGGGGALIAAGGGGAATVTVAGWSGMPVLLKGLTVAAVVATTGGAAVELRHVTKPDAPAPKTQAARPPAGSGSPTAPAPKAKLTPAAKTSTRRSRAARARSGHGTPRSRRGRGTFVAPRGEQVATPAAPVAATPPPAAPVFAPAPAHAPAPAPAQQQHQPQQAPAASPPTKKDPSKAAIDQLENIRQQVVDALEQAQSIAAGGSAAATQSANEMLQGTLGTLRPAIERILARVGLKLPRAAATPAPAPTTTTPSTSLPTVMAPVEQMLDASTRCCRSSSAAASRAPTRQLKKVLEVPDHNGWPPAW
jgi:RNA polymerase sigma factor (sigma-70 family)